MSVLEMSTREQPRPSRPGAAGAWSRRGPAQAGGFLIFKKKQVEDKKYRDEMKVRPAPRLRRPRTRVARWNEITLVKAGASTTFEACAC